MELTSTEKNVIATLKLRGSLPANSGAVTLTALQSLRDKGVTEWIESERKWKLKINPVVPILEAMSKLEGEDMTVIARELLENPDAMAWAKAFVQTIREHDTADPTDAGFMVGWFANAMAASDRGAVDRIAEIEAENDALRAALATVARTEAATAEQLTGAVSAERERLIARIRELADSREWPHDARADGARWVANVLAAEAKYHENHPQDKEQA